MPPGFEHLDKVLKKEEGSLASSDGKILLDFFALFTAERWIRHHHVNAIFVLDVGEVFGKRIRVNDVRCLDAMQNHVHDRDDIGERLLFLSVEGALLKYLCVFCCETRLCLEILKRFAKEPC